jgi:ATP phosphoribosyltransferase regulatory subunit
MLEPNETALLPEGLHDSLWGEAEFENIVAQKLLACFNSYGFQQARPPLVEFEESLLAGPAKKQSLNMFRVMDPMSQRMMAVRSDMTGQIARIARTRLKNEARPLRVSYIGDVLRVKGSQLRPERQFVQTGVELIGSESSQAYIEVILLARDALKDAGITGLSIDLIYPRFVPELCRELFVDEEKSKLIRHALGAKDIGELSAIEGEIGEISRMILKASGDAEKSISELKTLELPAKAAKMVSEFDALINDLKNIAPDLNITIDLGEYKNFEYQTGIAFTFFSRSGRGELGRGGRYMVNADIKGGSEHATGFSLYLDSLMRALPEQSDVKRIFIPFSANNRNDVAALREQGFRTVGSLEEEEDIMTEAKRLSCRFIWLEGRITEL